MDWLPSHKNLRSHPKTKKLARLLDISIPRAVGMLHCLWWWSIDYAPDGDFTDIDPDVIADAAGWEGDPDALVDALLRATKTKDGAGFLERTDGRLVIHEHYEYIGRHLDKAAKDAARKRQGRGQAKENQPASDSRPADVQRTSSGRPADVQTQAKDVQQTAQVEKRREEKRREELKSMRDTKEQVSLSSTAEALDDCDDPSECTDVAVVEGEIVAPVPEPLVPEGFDEFWTAYPRKEGSRKRAAVTWRRLTREKRRLALGIAQTMGTLHAQGIGPERQYIPLPTTFLNGEFWDGWRDGVPANWAPERDEVDELEEVAREYARAHGLEYAP